jgi:4-hydroxybenzoate polyprenyltransferase
MSEPESWPTWLQVPVVILLALGAALAWFTTEWGGLLVVGFGILVAIYLRYKDSN